jgi:localization factor PodJL
MKLGFPWSVKDIRPEARDTAREAARRAGLPVNEWLNAVILQQVNGQNANAFARSNNSGSADHESQNYSQVHLRLDNLARRMDQVTRRGPAAYASKRNREEADQVAELITRLEQRFDQFAATGPTAMPAAPPPVPPALDRAVAEINERRRALNGEPAPVAAPAPAPMPTQDLSGLENELRRITSQIETLRRPGVEEAINALRAELGAIGRTLNEAMPRRALEAIEGQIHELNQRIAEGRQAGVNSGALEGIERGLAEVRNALRDLTPAENLVGYTDAINALAHKVDLIVAQKDPATMMQLERSIATLRELAAHVASNETVNSLAAHVQSLGAKVDQLAISGASAAFSSLEHRIDEISRALAQRTQADDGVPGRLETLMQSMSDKIEQMQQARGEPVAFGHLEDRIVKLVQRLDASDARLGHLEAVERGLTDLLVHIEDLRANKQSSALRAEDTSGIDALKQDVARTQSTVEAMHGTLGQVVERLTVIEKDIHSDCREPAAPESDILELTQPAGNLGVGIAADAPEIVPQPAHEVPEDVPMQAPAMAPAEPAPVVAEAPPAPAQVIIRQPAASLAPVITNTPADQPLEPGSGPPRATMNAGARIVASEAALGGVRPAATATGSKSSFIAAARRAAQAAGQDPKARSPRADASKGNGKSLRSKMATRVKALFLAASIVAIVIGSIQFAGNIFNFGFFDSNNAKLTQEFDADTPTGDEPNPTADADTGTSPALADNQPALGQNPVIAPLTSNADITASLLAPPTLPAPAPSKSATAPAMPAIQPPLNINQAAQYAPPVTAMPALSAPLLSLPPASKADVTGSVTRAPANRPPQPATQPAADRLPAAIAGPRLRTAALSGDAGAAYEIAMRFSEGRGVPANLDEAAHWYELAASKGLTPAQFRYASMLEKGQGVKKDLESARKLYVAAAGKGHAKAMHNLAVLYAEGIDGKPDYASAAEWFRKAAEHGVADSQYNLGVLAARGIGMDRNIGESYKWFSLAAAQGDKDAGRKRDELATQLDAQTLASIQQALKSYTAQAQPAEAIAIPEPPGGWDRTPPAPEKPRAGGPLPIGAFNSGKL